MTTSKSPVYVMKTEADLTPFKAKVGTRTINLTHIGAVDQFELVELFAADDMGDLQFVTGVLRLALNDADLATLRASRPDRDALVGLYAAYKAHCGMNEGESAASPT